MFAARGLTGHEYRLFSLPEISRVRQLAESMPELPGLNVTIPYKCTILPFLDELDPAAAQIGAVNTVRIERRGKGVFLKGYNTDSPGFLDSIDLSGITSALILGTGGAAKAVRHALQSKGVRTILVSRPPVEEEVLPYSALTPSLIKSVQLIVNATPAGMFPNPETSPPFPFEHLTADHFLYDLVYNPAETIFLQRGRESGCRTQNGLRMLKHQAERAYLIWSSAPEPTVS